jgi:hypothetical protein
VRASHVGTVAAWVSWAARRYAPVPRQEVQWMVDELLQSRPHAINALTPPARHRLHTWLERRRSGEPLQYVLGTQPFGLLPRPLVCRRPVLIPRPETEHWVLALAALLKQHPRRRRLRILDLCTGSGCVALTLAHHVPHVDVLGIDLQPHAVAVAECNRQRMHRPEPPGALHCPPPQSLPVTSDVRSPVCGVAGWQPDWWAHTGRPSVGPHLLSRTLSQTWAWWHEATLHSPIDAASTVTLVQGDILSDAMLLAQPVDMVRVCVALGVN